MARPVRVERQRSIRAPQQRVYQLLSRVEGLPRFADIWLVADVLERSGGQVVAEFRGYFGGLPVESVQRVSLRPPGRLEFRQLRGTFKSLRGEYLIEPEGAGARLTARVEVEAGIPMLGDQAVQMALGAAVERMLNRVRDAAERDLPRLVAARRLPQPTAAPGGPEGTAGGPETTAVPEESAAGEPSRRRPGRRRRRRGHRPPSGSSPTSPPGPGSSPPAAGGGVIL